jgi:phage FluMu gp28-like protein
MSEKGPQDHETTELPDDGSVGKREEPSRATSAWPGGGKYFLPYQRRWILDEAPLKLMEKSRQVGASFTDAYDSVKKASWLGARLDVWISSRDETQAKLYVQDCAAWAKWMGIGAEDLGLAVFGDQGAPAYALEFANGRRIYSLSSNPNALAGKRGHVKLDEFALHQDQRLLYRVAKPVTTWGGQLCVISTHRGVNSVFNELVRQIREGGNPMGWSLHSVPLQTAVAEGLVERINQKTSRAETREQFLARLHAECLDEEQWLQEYCCTPADESAAFISFDMITACEDSQLQLLTPDELSARASRMTDHPLYLGVDVARKHDLCVFDLGEKIGDVVWDRLRLELCGKSFAEIKFELYRLLRLDSLKRCCLDATGLGMQLAEEAEYDFGWKVEPVAFTAAVKEELAFGLRRDFEDRKLRIPHDDRLTADLRGIRKEVTLSGNLRFLGESADSHCDRFWAKALRQHAARSSAGPIASVG